MFVVEGQEINDFVDWCALSMVFISAALFTVLMVVMCTLCTNDGFYVHNAHFALLKVFMCTMCIVKGCYMHILQY